MSPRRRRHHLTPSERPRVVSRVLALHHEGRAPSSIGNSVGLTASFVRILLAESGETANDEFVTVDPVHPMWLTDDEDARRAAILRRAARGARAKLQANAAKVTA
jgi:hypothetical protein